MKVLKENDGSLREIYVPDELDKTTSVIPKGIYNLNFYTDQIFAKPKMILEPLEDQKYISIESGIFKEVGDYVDRFYSKAVRANYEAMKARHRLGVLLYGPPGTGKSALVYLLAKKQVEESGAIALYCRGIDEAAHFCKKYKNEEKAPIIIILEEFDRDFDSGCLDDYPGYINLFLDSPQSPDNTCIIATTNFIENIPNALKIRPSRFALVKEIKTVPLEVIQEFVNDMVPDEIIEKRGTDKNAIIDALVEAQVTIDEAKNIIQNHIMYGFSIEEAIDAVAELRKLENKD
jgi:DNA polymerase III delta prime subunit